LIIADSSPLIALARIQHLALLRMLADRVVVPLAVWDEVTKAQSDAPGAREVAAQSWIEIIAPDDRLAAPFLELVGRGEAEAMALAQAHPGSLLLLDDLRSRKLAERLHLRRIGTVALLARAKRAGMIQTLRPVLEALQAQGVYIRKELIDAALREVGE
jgi:hypothetical protein